MQSHHTAHSINALPGVAGDTAKYAAKNPTKTLLGAGFITRTVLQRMPKMQNHALYDLVDTQPCSVDYQRVICWL